jgi:hypothetical protein
MPSAPEVLREQVDLMSKNGSISIKFFSQMMARLRPHVSNDPFAYKVSNY